ncbi:transporter [Bacillus coahuilensis p1.1.43]|uniref:Transporter n=1 Tax=Bacillus coahuilensis p1.1.43 TaxID=1150625 RepID=A0A147K6M7_9BACI|nr:EamA family transporter RarD [Bacillus coahuilensis]KUP05551.1 transporter [Bacillus coahuilensis p1.1.43]
MRGSDEQAGLIYTASAYLLWGILPLYWKLLEHVPADEILANRIFWSFWFMLAYLLVTKRFVKYKQAQQKMFQNKRQFFALLTASLLISANWFIYIYAVNTEQMVQASLGYYINPLVSIFLGIVVLKEKLKKMHIASLLLACTGVIILTISYGRIPWIALGLAVSFGLYGLAKKLIKVEAAVGLTLETLTISPLAFLYFVYLWYSSGSIELIHGSFFSIGLLIGAGAVTAVPLLLFGKGAQAIPLFLVGFLQYIAPTITLLLGVLLYNESFGQIDLLAFCFIWAALVMVSVNGLRVHATRHRKISA